MIRRRKDVMAVPLIFYWSSRCGSLWKVSGYHFGLQACPPPLFIPKPLFASPNFHIYLNSLLWIPSLVLLRQFYCNFICASASGTQDNPNMSRTDQAMPPNLCIQLRTMEITNHSHFGTVSRNLYQSHIHLLYSPLSTSATPEASADNLISS